ncbi:MAG: 2TM domain-containing protein [Pseudomonadota bacterium]|nr:2TM domain-containing protein [Pseudomonadota bacterium]
MRQHDHPETHERRERLARRRAGAKMGWFIHALAYLCVNAGLAVLSWSAGRAWHVYPLLGWGLGLVIHGLAVWLCTGGGGLYERLLNHERQRLQ